MLLKDRVALITGAGRGIGQGVALRLAQEGAELAPAGIQRSDPARAGKPGDAMRGLDCAAKAGVILLAQTMAKELGPHKITVNALCPGTIDTPLLRGGLEPVPKATGMSLEEGG